MTAIAQTVGLIFNLINLMILIRILMSWLPMAGIQIDPYNPIVRVLFDTTDIFLEPFRRLIPPVSGIDFSPIVAIIVLGMVQQVVMSLLLGAA